MRTRLCEDQALGAVWEVLMGIYWGLGSLGNWLGQVWFSTLRVLWEEPGFAWVLRSVCWESIGKLVISDLFGNCPGIPLGEVSGMVLGSVL